MIWDESKHPRDEMGRFTDGSSLAQEYKPNLEIEKLKGESIESLKLLASRNVLPKKVFSDGQDTNSYFNTKTQQRWENSLTQSQKDTIYSYTNDGYKDINYFLRYNDNIGQPSKSEVLRQISEIDKALESSVLYENIQVYRAVDSTIFYWNNDVSELEGQFFDDKAYMSSTPTLDSEALTQDTILTITVPKGMGNGAYINNISKYKNQEYEFLIPRNKRFRINKAYKEKDTYKIEMEMLK